MLTLVYVHDPMCSWCWGFSACLEDLLGALPQDVRVRRLLGGLAPDSDAPMPESTRRYVKSQWRRIQQEIPGTRFNFDFWRLCAPRRSTYPACRAVIAARQQGQPFDLSMTRAIQRAYYLQAKNPSDYSTLLALAGEMGVDVKAFESAYRSPAVETALAAEIEEARALGVRGFPSLVLTGRGIAANIQVDYLDHRPMLAQIQNLAATG